MTKTTFTAWLAALLLVGCGSSKGHAVGGAPAGTPPGATGGAVTPNGTDTGTSPVVTPVTTPTPEPTPAPTGTPGTENPPVGETPALATPTAVIEGAHGCAVVAPMLGLSGTFIQGYIPTDPVPTAPVDIGSGETATLSFANGERKLFSWSATTPISFILAFGDTSMNAFVYDPAASSDAKLLSAPDHDDIWLVKVCYLAPPPPAGCTLTPGYWMTHSENGPASYDETWAQIGEDASFFLSGKTYHEVMWTPPEGNAYFTLAHHYIAAKLNVLAGASIGDLQDELDRATAIFEQNTPEQALSLDMDELTSLAAALAAYNEGAVGPGHCDSLEALPQ